MPTILDLLQVRHYLELDGRNLFTDNTEVPLLSEASGYGYEKRALIDGKFKLLYSNGDKIAWLFDLEKDPNDLNPTSDSDIVSMFINKLSRILARDEKHRIRKKIRTTGLGPL